MARPFAKDIYNVPEQALGGCPLGLGLVVEDRPLEFSCTRTLQWYFKIMCTMLE